MKFFLNSILIIVICYGCTGMSVPVGQLLPFLLIENNQPIKKPLSEHTLASLNIPKDVQPEKLNVIHFSVKDEKLIQNHKQETFATAEPLIHTKVK